MVNFIRPEVFLRFMITYLTSAESLEKICETQPKASGINALIDRLPSLCKADTIYYRNNRFTNRPSIFDKAFGKKVYPINNIGELDHNDEKYVFLNGVIVSYAMFDSVKKTAITSTLNIAGRVTAANIVPQQYTEYRTVIEGKIEEKPIRVYARTSDKDLAQRLENLEKGSVIYAFGCVDRNYDIDSILVGNAFVK